MLSVFSQKSLNEALNVMDVLSANGEGINYLRESVIAFRTGKKISKAEPVKTSKKKTKPTRANRVIPTLKPGQVEEMSGVVCKACHEQVYIEVACGANAIVKKGFTRYGLCGTCGNEFLIR